MQLYIIFKYVKMKLGDKGMKTKIENNKLFIELDESDKELDLVNVNDINEVYVKCNVKELPVFKMNEKFTSLKLTLDGDFEDFQNYELSNVLVYFSDVNIINNKHFRSINNNSIVDNDGKLIGIINPIALDEGIKILNSRFVSKFPFDFPVSFPKSLEVLKYNFDDKLNNNKDITVNSKLHIDLDVIKAIDDDTMIYQGFQKSCRSALYDQVTFVNQDCISDDWYDIFHEQTLLYVRNFNINNSLPSNLNINLMFGSIYYGVSDIQENDFYKFYMMHKDLVDNKIEVVRHSNDIKIKFNELKKIWENNKKLEINKDEYTFKNTFIYKEYDDHFDILGLNTTDISNANYDELYIPCKLNNKIVNLPFYFHVNPLYDDTKISINKLIIDGGFKTIYSYLFPNNDHSGETKINELILEEGIERIEGLLNDEEEYTTVKKLYIPSSVNYIKNRVLCFIDEIIIDPKNEYFKIDENNKLINIKENKEVIVVHDAWN